MGSRQKVLLIEGTRDKSIDVKLYPKIYQEYNVIPMESCNAVIQTTKSYNQTNELHYVEVKGIIDRDRRDDAEIERLKENNIYVPAVSEIENLFLLPEVIEIVAAKQEISDVGQILCEVKEKTFDFLSNKIEEQALLFTKQRNQNSIIQKINKSVSSFEDYKKNMDDLVSLDDLQEIYNQEIERMNRIIEEKDFLEALKIINNKGLLPYTQISNKFGWKKDFYIDYILRLLDQNNETSEKLESAFRKNIAEL